MTAKEGMGPCFYSSLPRLAAHEYPDIYVQHYMRDGYLALLIARLVIQYLIELPFGLLMMECKFLKINVKC